VTTKHFPSEFQGANTLAEDIAIKHFGERGRCLGSKSIYVYDNPKNVVVFNANLCTSSAKIWHGDIDVTNEFQKIKSVAVDLGQNVYVLYEMDARFENSDNPKLDRAVVVARPDGSLSFDGSGHVEMAFGAPSKKVVKKKEKRAPEVLSEADYEAIEIPDVKKIKVTKTGMDPLSQFQDFFRRSYGDKATGIYGRLFVTSADMDILVKLSRRYAKKTMPGLHPAKLEQSVQMYLLDMAPGHFDDPQDWERPKTGYLLE